MKRSEINILIENALYFFSKMNFMLPAWASWTLYDWEMNKDRSREIFDNMLGWDITDFGSGNFNETGLLLFSLRNGNLQKGKKVYAEKIMIVEEKQVTPMHFHWKKMEDIINRGGGNLCIELYPSNEKEEFAAHPFVVSIDGVENTLSPGDTICLKPGESICLYSGLYHRFYGEAGKGKVLVGEVSSVNDDKNDNRFKNKVGRFPDIIEDVEPRYLLVGDYIKLGYH